MRSRFDSLSLILCSSTGRGWHKHCAMSRSVIPTHYKETSAVEPAWSPYLKVPNVAFHQGHVHPVNIRGWTQNVMEPDL